MNTLGENNLLEFTVKLLLDCGEDYHKMKQAIDRLYEIFKSITGVDINKLNEGDIHLPSGKAISPSGAAHCLLEMKRTTIFLRGIKKAIDLKISRNNNPVQILYAGCGPYATLIVPLLHFYSKDRLRVTFLDVNRESLDAAKRLLIGLRLDGFAEQFVLADATTFKVYLPYDIVISETMQSALKNEPQVAIMQNLGPQIPSGAIFIPQEITIDAFLTNPKMEMDRLMYYEKEQPPFERYKLGNIFVLSKNDLNTILQRKKLTIPKNALAKFPVLTLFTNVRVFDNEVLTGNDSSITLPKQFYDFRRQNAQEIEFWYIQGKKPQIKSTFIPEKPIVNNFQITNY